MKNTFLFCFLVLTQILSAQQPAAETKTSGLEPLQTYNLATVETRPEFPGGMAEFYNYIAKNYRSPNVKDLNGKVLVTFVVDTDGKLSDIKVIRDIGFGTGQEAIRILEQCPKWIPGSQNGKNVRVIYSLPINIATPK